MLKITQNTRDWAPLIQQVEKFTSCLLFAVKNSIITLGTPPFPPKYMVATRELKFIFLRTLTCL